MQYFFWTQMNGGTAIFADALTMGKPEFRKLIILFYTKGGPKCMYSMCCWRSITPGDEEWIKNTIKTM